MHKIFKHTLFKVFTLNGISVLVKMLVSFLSVKLYALLIGPEGFALIGNFKNFSNSIKTFSTIGFDNGVVSLVSKTKKENRSLQKIYATAFYSRFLGSVFISIVLFLLPQYLGAFLFKNDDLDYVIYLFAVFLPFYSINNLLISILNGLGKFNRLILVNIISTLLGLLILGFLIFYLKLRGVFIYLSVGEAIIIIVTLVFLRKQGVFFSIKQIDKNVLRNLLRFSVMALASAIIVPVSNLFIRDLIIDNLNVLQAGYWDALDRLSNYYMLIITSSISIYYLPKISGISTVKEFNNELKSYLKIFGVGFILLSVVIFLLKDEVICFVLTDKFYPVADLLIYQLLADFFKLIVLFFGYKMIADRDVKKYIFAEMLFYVIYVSLSFFAIKNLYDTKYVVISYLLSYIVILIVMLRFYRSYIFKK